MCVKTSPGSVNPWLSSARLTNTIARHGPAFPNGSANAFEADVVAGVEQADDEGREVQTHEVLEDDVPEEYQDKD
ncbi:MAG TPA: hypothetical protein VMQ17_09655 [Candidatus Sulfotelmatobacter sp.]|nr:hypothetical protein [Candidatus Sulfotelmatobacter sp.]